MNKNQQKNKVKKIIDDFCEEIIAGVVIDSEGYPHDPYAESLSVESHDFYAFIDKINKEIGNDKSVSELFMPMSIEDILREINISNYRYFEDLTEVDVITDADSDPKYSYVTYIYQHKPTVKYISITIQRSGDVDIDIVVNGQVEKKEVVTFQWEGCKTCTIK